MKKILLLLMMMFLASNVMGAYGIVNNTGTTPADSISIPYFALDSAGNSVALTTNDSVFFNVYYPSGALAYRDSLAYNGTKVTSQTFSDYTQYTWKEAIADIDGTPVNGVYSYHLVVNDQTGAALATHHTGTFQLITETDFHTTMAQLTDIFDGTATVEANIASATTNALELADFSGPTAWWNEGKTGYALTTADWTTVSDLSALALEASLFDPTTDSVIVDNSSALADGGLIDSIAQVSSDSIWINATRTLTVADWTVVADLAPLAYFDTLVHIGPYGLGVWIDESSGNTNTVVGTDGTEMNPVSTFAAAKTIATALGIRRYYITGRSTFVGAADSLTVTHEEWEFIGIGSGNAMTLDYSTPVDVDASVFINLTISGGQGGTENVNYYNCIMGEFRGFDGSMFNTGLSDTIHIASSDDAAFDACYSLVAGNGRPGLSFNAGASNVVMRHYSGGIEIHDMDTNDKISIEGHGQIVVNADCTAPNITARGHFTLTDNDGATVWTRDAIFSLAQDSIAFQGPAGSFNYLTDSVIVDVSSAMTAGNLVDSIAAQSADSTWVSALRTLTAGAITAATIADNAIDYATFAGVEPTVWWNEAKTGYFLGTDAITAAVIQTDAFDADAFATSAIDEFFEYDTTNIATATSIGRLIITAGDTTLYYSGQALQDTILYYTGFKATSFSYQYLSGDRDTLVVGIGTDTLIDVVYYHIGGTAGDPPDSTRVQAHP